MGRELLSVRIQAYWVSKRMGGKGAKVIMGEAG